MQIQLPMLLQHLMQPWLLQPLWQTVLHLQTQLDSLQMLHLPHMLIMPVQLVLLHLPHMLSMPDLPLVQLVLLTQIMLVTLLQQHQHQLPLLQAMLIALILLLLLLLALGLTMLVILLLLTLLPLPPTLQSLLAFWVV